MDYLSEKFFQKDGTRAHSSKVSQIEIKKLFGDHSIQTWEN